MPLHLTKVAFGATSLDHLIQRLSARAALGPVELTTRYLPKRHAEIADPEGAGGSLYWIVKHQLVARSPILGFGEVESGRVSIRLDPVPVLVQARGRRAHQGWRYLEGTDAPPDLVEGTASGIEQLPADLQGALAGLALL